jgi:HemY protein
VQLLATSQQWLELERVLRQAIKANVRDMAQNKADLAACLLALSDQAVVQKDYDTALAQARAAHQMLPYFAPAIIRIAQAYVALGDSKKAEKLLREAWGEQPHPSYVPLLKSLDTTRLGVAWYQFLEKFTLVQANHPETHMALANAAVEGALWGLARDHYQQLLAMQPTTRVYQGLAVLERAEGLNAARAQVWVDQALQATPDNAWVAANGTRLPQWQPVVDGEFNALAWGHKANTAKYFLAGGLLG